MDNYCYVPSLKSKRGEKLALRGLSTKGQNKIKPIINATKVIDVNKFYNGIAFVDLHENLFKNASEEDIKDYYEQIYNDTINKSELTSIIKHNYSTKLIKQIKPFLFNIDNGIALRIPQACLPSLEKVVKNIADVLSIDSNKIDVIIDFECINSIVLNLVNEISDNIKNAVSNVSIKNIIILSSAFPTGINISNNTIGDLPRYDWALYLRLNKLLPNIIFGDYGADDPFDPQINSRMNIVPTIRYTTSDCWKIIRGHYDPMRPFDYSQYHELSKKVIGCDFYKGREFSLGDKIIDDCANEACSNGNPETWVKVAINHHLTFVIDECDHLL